MRNSGAQNPERDSALLLTVLLKYITLNEYYTLEKYFNLQHVRKSIFKYFALNLSLKHSSEEKVNNLINNHSLPFHEWEDDLLEQALTQIKGNFDFSAIIKEYKKEKNDLFQRCSFYLENRLTQYYQNVRAYLVFYREYLDHQLAIRKYLENQSAMLSLFSNIDKNDFPPFDRPLLEAKNYWELYGHHPLEQNPEGATDKGSDQQNKDQTQKWEFSLPEKYSLFFTLFYFFSNKMLLLSDLNESDMITQAAQLYNTVIAQPLGPCSLSQQYYNPNLKYPINCYEDYPNAVSLQENKDSLYSFLQFFFTRTPPSTEKFFEFLKDIATRRKQSLQQSIEHEKQIIALGGETEVISFIRYSKELKKEASSHPPKETLTKKTEFNPLHLVFLQQTRNYLRFIMNPYFIDDGQYQSIPPTAFPHLNRKHTLTILNQVNSKIQKIQTVLKKSGISNSEITWMVKIDLTRFRHSSGLPANNVSLLTLSGSIFWFFQWAYHSSKHSFEYEKALKKAGSQLGLDLNSKITFIIVSFLHPPEYKTACNLFRFMKYEKLYDVQNPIEQQECYEALKKVLKKNNYHSLLIQIEKTTHDLKTIITQLLDKNSLLQSSDPEGCQFLLGWLEKKTKNMPLNWYPPLTPIFMI